MRNYPRVFASFMPNAPRCTGVPGSWLDVMKKCLTGGWTPFDVSSIVVENGVATINYNYADCSLPDYCMLLITGCSEPMLNGEVTITNGNLTTGKFETTVADGTYGGTIKATPVHAGWEIMFSGTNQAVIRSGNPDSSRTVVQLIDTNAYTCNFEFAYDATSLTALINRHRTEFDVDKCVVKSVTANATDFRAWCIVADNTTVYMLVDHSYNNGSSVLLPQSEFIGGTFYYFGDYISSIVGENRSFGFFFPYATSGSSTVYNYANNSPLCQSTSVVDDTNYESYGRFFTTSNYVQNRNWTISSYNPDRLTINNSDRVTGSNSNLGFYNINNLEKAYREIPVYAKVYSIQSSYMLYGKLPGLRYSDIFIRYMFNQFTASKLGDTAYFYLPCSYSARTSNQIESSFGYLPIVINKTWE